MLTVSEAIRQRRSIRSFRSDPVPDDMVHEILEAARLAPSASNRQPWRFIVVTDGKEKARLRKICLDQAFIEEAPVVLVCCTDLTAYSQSSRKKRAQEFIDYGVTETLYLAVLPIQPTGLRSLRSQGLTLDPSSQRQWQTHIFLSSTWFSPQQLLDWVRVGWVHWATREK